MKIARLKGFTGEILTRCNTHSIKLNGSSTVGGGFGSLLIDNVTAGVITSNAGLYVILLSEDLTVVSSHRFLMTSSAPTGQRDVDFIALMGTLQPRTYFALVSNVQIGHSVLVDNYMANTLGSTLWGQMWDSYEFLNGSVTSTGDLSFVAFGNTLLKITHENTSSSGNSALSVGVGSSYEAFGNTGYGLPLHTLSNTMVGFETFEIEKTPAISGIALSIKYTASSDTDVIITKHLSGGATTTATLTLESANIHRTIFKNILFDVDVWKITIGISNIMIRELSIHKSSGVDIPNLLPRMIKRSDSFSIDNIVFSMCGLDFNKPTHVERFGSQGNILPDIDGTENIISDVSLRYKNVSGTFTSELISIDSLTDYYIAYFYKNNTSNSAVSVYVKTYDDNQDLIETITYPTEVSSSEHILGTHQHDNTTDVLYQEFYLFSERQEISDSFNSTLLGNVHGEWSNGGNSANISNVQSIPILSSSVKFIVVEVQVSGDIRLIEPQIEPIRFSVSNDATYNGNVN